jgi:hypothetical protein
MHMPKLTLQLAGPRQNVILIIRFGCGLDRLAPTAVKILNKSGRHRNEIPFGGATAPLDTRWRGRMPAMAIHGSL